jgi:hypothetical protein
MTYTFDAKTVSDLYKDVHGFRPGAMFYTAWNAGNDDQKQVMWDNLITGLDIVNKEEQAHEQQAIASFEKHIASLESISNSRKQSIRWIIEGLELTDSDKMYGGDYICYKLGLPYSYAKEFDLALQELAYFG